MQGLSEQLFRQQIRFKENNKNDFPDWEEKFGNKVFESISDKNHNSDLPILAITQEHGAIPRSLIDYNITVTEKSIENYKVVQVGDFIISLRSFQGGIEYSNYKGICSPAYIILRAVIPINEVYFKYYFKTGKYITELNRKLEGIRDGKMISYGYFSEIPLLLPSIAEQTRIANFLSSIDEKIATEKVVLQQYENQKKYLLQNMFI
jgi:type I restriction enzyme S subunit